MLLGLLWRAHGCRRGWPTRAFARSRAGGPAGARGCRAGTSSLTHTSLIPLPSLPHPPPPPPPSPAAPLLAIWGVGSFAGGLLAARLGGGARTAAGLALILGALTAGHLALIPAAGSVVTLGGVLLLAGATIAPTEATIYAMVDHATPAATMTEAFAWLATAMAVGGAVGAASAGLLVDRAGPTAGFALAGGAGALAVLTTMLRSRTLALATRPSSPSSTPTQISSPPSKQPPDRRSAW